MKIGIIGNPNCGKSALYNLLTGENVKTGNWSGVTVGNNTSTLKKKYTKKIDKKIELVDLPGTYHIDFSSLDEKVTIDYIKSGNLDLIINVIEATSLERSLTLTNDLKNFNIPILVIINKIDILDKKNIQIDFNKLSELLNLPVFPISVTKKKGIETLINEITRR